MVNNAQQSSDRKWLTLGLARALLGINEATLRQWADAGLVRAFRTPGGHRRFSAEDIYQMMEPGTRETITGVHVEDASVLPSIRRKVKTERPHGPAWMEHFDADGHKRMRDLGRELVDLCLGTIEDPASEAGLAATALGATYGQELASHGLRLSEALEGFAFFRGATSEALKPALLREGTTPEETFQAIERMAKLTDHVLAGMALVYDRAPRRSPRQAASQKDNG